MEDKLATVPGITLYMQAVQDISVETQVSRTQYQYTMESVDSSDLDTWVPLFVQKLQSYPQLRDVATDQQAGALQANLVVDRDTASRLGLTPQAIDDTLEDAFGQRLVSIMYTQVNQYHVVVEVAPEFRQDTQALSKLFVKSTTGTQVPLTAFTHLESSVGPLTVNHLGQFRSTTISFNLAPGASLGDAIDIVNKTQSELGMPQTVQTSFQGTAAAFQNSLANEGWLLLAAMVTVYIVLGVLYESYIHPLTILSTLPSAGVGAILALQLFHLDLERHRIDRHHPADRHREEERHHDDRLRAGSGAERRRESGGFHPSGLPAAVPADHDDHDGGIVRRAFPWLSDRERGRSCVIRWASPSSAAC